MTIRTATSFASALPPCRVLLLGGGVLLISESMLLATTLFAAAALTLVASFAIAVTIYRASARERALRQDREAFEELERISPTVTSPAHHAQVRAGRKKLRQAVV